MTAQGARLKIKPEFQHPVPGTKLFSLPDALMDKGHFRNRGNNA
jgi:hypothetical protein